MSIRVMTAVWDVTLPDSEKIVLLALADAANDEGWCWPGMKRLMQKCSKTDRTIQAAIKSLVAGGHLTRIEKPGKGCDYCVHPRSDFTPEATSPPKPATKTPEATSGHPRSGFGQTVKEPSRTVGRARARAAPTAADLINGKSKKGKVKDRTPRGSRLADDWTPPPVADLSPKARALVQQWPAGAFEAVCETFSCHWHSVTLDSGWKSDWGAALTKWLISDHSKIMRDAKAGVSFAQIAPAGADMAGDPASRLPVIAKGFETPTSAAIHKRLYKELGSALHGQWLGGSAILIKPSDASRKARVEVISGSQFLSGWIEGHFQTQIANAARNVLGADVEAVRFQVEQLATQGAGGQ